MRQIYILVSFLLIAPSYGAIRVYNPETGTTEAAPSLKSGDAPAAPKITTEPKEIKRHRVKPILLPEEEEAAELASRSYPLGELVFFVDFRNYTLELGTFIKKIQAIEALKTEAYMESKNPKEYLKDMIMLQREGKIGAEQNSAKIDNMPILISDKKSRAFIYHRPGKWHKAVYYDGAGSKRIYDLKYETDKLMRHIKRISRNLKKSGGTR